MIFYAFFKSKKNKNLSRVKPNNGFTLAEILIALGIIGIVAALTIPAIMQNMQDKEFKSAWIKAYSVISQAYQLVKNDHEGDLSEYFTTTTTGAPKTIVSEMGNYLTVTYACGIIVWYGDYICGPNKVSDVNVYKTLDGGYVAWPEFTSGQYILKDGTHLFFRYDKGDYFIIWADVNGFAKGPNTLGKDLLGVVVTKDKIVPMGAVGTGVENTCNSNVKKCPAGSYGFANASSDSCAGASCSMEYLTTN